MADNPDAALPDADAAAALLLRHRLFPRAMAWTVHHQSASPTPEQLVMAAAQVLEQQQQQQQRQPPAPRVDTMDVARSFPLLQASVAGLDETARRPRPVTPPPMRRASSVAEGDERERLFRAVGKFLDGPRAAPASQGYAQQQQPVYYQAPPAPIRRPYGGMPSPDRMTAEQQAAFQAMKISSYAEEEQRSWAARGQILNSGLRTPPAPVPVPSASPPGVHQIRLRSPPRAETETVASGKKRTRGSTPEAPAASTSTSTSTAVGKDEIAPSLARALLTGCGAKQCSFEGCKKIAVSKGRCRGHGGGRRCQHQGCTKCAQSRSPFCWAHGGGKRCEAPNCRRSRKTKRFCVDHVDMELTVPMPDSDSVPKPMSTKAAKAASKSKTSSSSYTSADSDDSVGRQSTVSCDSGLSAVHNKENMRMPSGEYVLHEQRKYTAQYHQYAGEVSGIPPPALQLPSLNEALLRTVPTQYSSETVWTSATTTPSPPAPLASRYKSEFRSWPGTSD
ncbi:hypothetical protein PHYSODRAFT_563385 [Phytophthora sojae]|uniref:WRKY19-like zinc finger domain-containing protein n=1 Tax=Phytophthora sojae (strain P6497) TaxID=1094619 RepID=G4ZXZ9_PHYSP|nr:hypothetical protein PHYSODRAFT_563385 [Phytophthora sojae]EGZ12659.1 hypothetical protein PHYSODRAFT_563385 [Phytophthora sojae]|eukprot:XP_009532992.1 hypothetical protein PHYSODRAFT_563385 [Phytophthora sojae]